VNPKRQIDFTPIPFHLSSMNLHIRGAGHSADSVVIFVHGLNGEGYKTWGEFPRRIFEGTAGIKPDVAIFDYFSGKRRYLRARPQVPQVAEALARCIGELAGSYDQVFVVAHSLGGLISRDAVRFYLQNLDQSPRELKRLAGLILFSSPLKGSKWAIRFAWPAMIEIKYLRRNAEYQSSIQEFFNKNVDTTDLDRFGNRDYMLPIFAGFGDKDWVVNLESATDGIFHKQQHSFRAGHSKIVKPTLEAFEQVTWLEEKIHNVSLHRAKIREQLYRDRRANDSVAGRGKGRLVTEMLSSPAVHEWRVAYHDVVDSASTQLVDVLDIADAEQGSDMLISVHAAVDIVNNAPASETNLKLSKGLYDNREADIRIVSIGSPKAHAKKLLLDQLVPSGSASSRPWLFIDAVDDVQQLRERLNEYLSLMTGVIEQQMRWASHRSIGRRMADNEAIMSVGDF